jgi:hypothetical protein
VGVYLLGVDSARLAPGDSLLRIDLRHQHQQGEVMTEDEDKPTPADGQLIWILWAFIVLMLGLLTLKSCL